MGGQNMRRSLILKWLFTLLFTGLIGVVLVGLFANRATANEFDRLKLEQAEADFATVAKNYYVAHGSWAGIAQWIHDNMAPPEPRGPGSPPAPQFMLVDSTNHVVMSAPHFQEGDFVGGDQLAQGKPIVIDNVTVGTVVLTEGTPMLNPLEQQYLDRINRALMLAAVGASLISLLVGLLLARYFMRPLRDLTAAIRAMRHGNLEQQVTVRSQDELGELTRAFNQMSRDLARSNFLRRQMTADIAHDLRTPLTVIAGYLEGLQDGTFKPTQPRFATMHQEVIRLTGLVEDLRTLSLADAGELKLTYQEVSAVSLLKHVAASFEPLARDKAQHLDVAVDPNLPLLRVDRERMLQVLGNLVTNALRHTPENGKVTLRAALDLPHKQVILSVEDTGEGIPADKLPHIFERFYRVDEARSQSDSESGLGLAIAKSIVEAHSGTITATSIVDQGTNMQIHLPIPENALIVPERESVPA